MINQKCKVSHFETSKPDRCSVILAGLEDPCNHHSDLFLRFPERRKKLSCAVR